MPLLLMPVAMLLSVRLWMSDGYFYLIYFPLALMVAMLLVFDWRAVPGIILSLSSSYFFRYDTMQAIIIVGIFLLTLLCGWTGYRLQTLRRWRVDYGNLEVMPARLFWLVFFVPTLLTSLMQLMTSLGLLPLYQSVFSREPFSLHTLLNLQSLQLTCLTMIQICYLFIRSLRNPRFIYLCYLRIRSQSSPNVRLMEYLLWWGVIVFFLVALTRVSEPQHNLLNTDYGLPLLLPLMLWAAVRFGYLFTSLSWGILLIVLYQLHDRFINISVDPRYLSVLSANLLVFSLSILFISVISSRQRRTIARVRAAALNDSVMNLPNLRALNKALGSHPCSTLCFISIPDLDRLTRTYGLRVRIQYKRGLANYLKPELLPGEEVYQLPGFDLVMRLTDREHTARIENIAARLKDYHLSWNGLPIHTQLGVSYCSVRPPVLHLYELLGEMGRMAEVSLTSGMAENLQQNINLPVQHQITKKIALLDEIQLALRMNGFLLMAQKNCGIRGDDYYEITLRMPDRNGGLVQPAELFMVINEFGLHWAVNRWVIATTLAFIDRHRETMPGLRVSVNLYTASLCRPKLAGEVKALLAQFDVEAWQLILVVAESPILTDYSWGNRSIAQLRQQGSRVAINNFGSGYSSFASLKDVQVDMLTIDGNFVCNMANNSLDNQIIESICALARLRNMQVVAKCVATEEVAGVLRKLGVDYLQGPLFGQPFRLEDLTGENPDKSDKNYQGISL
ncbi:EAL domain-containing protein [Erwinia papayae]|uniref:EAL domain-containing protein n=1 Tax=Erwinia papayae TaxID=206499 RepID=A0ABV3MXP0_9GAMM